MCRVATDKLMMFIKPHESNVGVYKIDLTGLQ